MMEQKQSWTAACCVRPLLPCAHCACCDASLSLQVKVLAADGAQTEIDISVGSVSLSTVSLTATYRYYTYLRNSILTAVEYHAVPVLPVTASRQGAAEGRALLQQPLTLQAAAEQVGIKSSSCARLVGQAAPEIAALLAGYLCARAGGWRLTDCLCCLALRCCVLQVFTGSFLPDMSCSNQWSLSLNLAIPAALIAAPGGSTVRLLQLLSVLSDATFASAPAASWPSVGLKVSAAGTALVVQWGLSAVREQAVSIQSNKDGWASVHVAVVRDGSRLGVWLDSSGSWLLQDVWCVPSSTGVNYCTQHTAQHGADGMFTALRLGAADGSSSSDISVTSARVYNYALPRLSLGSESVCVEEGSCGRFLLSGWAPPAASSIPSGSISCVAVVAVASTPIRLRATSYYLLVSV